MRKSISILLILLGASFLLYPSLQSWAAQRTQEQLLNDYLSKEMTYTLPSDINVEEVVEQVYSENEHIVSTEVNESLSDKLIQSSINDGIIAKVKKPDPKKKAIGILEIDSIDFKQVIMPTANDGDLLVSVGHVTETSWIDDQDNICIAGHRSKVYGRNFNRLEEIALGDEIKITSDNEVHVYKVTETFIVAPEDVWVLQPVKNKKIITLITCTPMENPTHRYIVRGQVIQN